MRVELLICVALAAATLCAGAGAQSRRPSRTRSVAQRGEARREWSWEGSYRFQEGDGHGGFVEHTIVVSRADDGLTARINAEGLQTSRSLKCDVKVEGDKLSLYFREYGEDNLLAEYRKGQLLLTLEKTVEGGATKIVTHWSAYRPVLKELKSGGVYFRKTK